MEMAGAQVFDALATVVVGLALGRRWRRAAGVGAHDNKSSDD